MPQNIDSISTSYTGVILIKRKEIVSQIILIVFGTIVGLLLVSTLFAVTIGDIRLLRTYFYDDTVVFREGMGDILFWQSEYIAPLENPDEILSVHRLRLDELGFRIPANPSDNYDVVVLGDSFTEGANVATPWTDTFAQVSGLRTRNLGFRGYGIRHHTWTWQEYGSQENPEVLIIGFFGGNDVFTAGLDIESPFPTPLEQRANDLPLEPITQNLIPETAIYPIYLDDGTPITFLSTYISWMNATEHQLTQSVNYQVIEANLREIHATASAETCLIFAYFPSKPEVYFPYLQLEDYPTILDEQKQVLLNNDGTLHIVEDFEISVEKVIQNRLNTGNVMTELATSLGYEALNLQAVLDEAAANGEMLYYTYDTHWNQAGQHLVGETLADFTISNCL